MNIHTVPNYIRIYEPATYVGPNRMTRSNPDKRNFFIHVTNIYRKTKSNLIDSLVCPLAKYMGLYTIHPLLELAKAYTTALAIQ